MNQSHKLFLSATDIRLIGPSNDGPILVEFQFEDSDRLVEDMQHAYELLCEKDPQARCDVWLPEDQIRVLNAFLPENGVEPMQFAKDLIARSVDVPLSELCFDHHVENGIVWISVVAQKTIEEARHFASEFSFNVLNVGASSGIHGFQKEAVYSQNLADVAWAPLAPRTPAAPSNRWMTRAAWGMTAALGVAAIALAMNAFVGSGDNNEALFDQENAALNNDEIFDKPEETGDSLVEGTLPLTYAPKMENPPPLEPSQDRLNWIAGENTIAPEIEDRSDIAAAPRIEYSRAEAQQDTEEALAFARDITDEEEIFQDLPFTEGEIEEQNSNPEKDNAGANFVDPLTYSIITAQWSKPPTTPVFDITMTPDETELYAASIDPEVNFGAAQTLPKIEDANSLASIDPLREPLPGDYETETLIPEGEISDTAQLANLGDTTLQDQNSGPATTQDTNEPLTTLAQIDGTAPPTPSADDGSTANTDGNDALRNALQESLQENNTLAQSKAPLLRPVPSVTAVAPQLRPTDTPSAGQEITQTIEEEAQTDTPDAETAAVQVEAQEPQVVRITMLTPRLRPNIPAPQPQTTAASGGTSLAIFSKTVTQKLPQTRPGGFDKIVKKTNARQTEIAKSVQQERKPSSSSVTASGPVKSRVSKNATEKRTIALNKDVLIGVFGRKNRLKALMRTKRGRYVKLAVGDRFGGGRVAAISDSELRLKKGSRNVVYKLN